MRPRVVAVHHLPVGLGEVLVAHGEQAQALGGKAGILDITSISKNCNYQNVVSLPDGQAHGQVVQVPGAGEVESVKVHQLAVR